jgi:predicted enzyme related to lactoylglutathione lyase
MPKICFTTILVDDMAKAVAFYEGCLGFEVTKKDHYPHFVLLNHALYPIALHQVEQAQVVAYPTQAQVIPGIATDDLAATIQQLQEKGVELIHTTPQKFFGGYYAALHDPAGNVLELVQWMLN